MKHVGKGIGIEEMLRIVGAVDVARPRVQLAAGAQPQTTLASKLEGGENSYDADGCTEH